MLVQERFCDFHTHTTHSDGTFTPAEVVKLGKKNKLSCLAITDHDTTSGLDEAIETGQSMGVEVIPGVELSVIFEPGTLHILGYFIDRDSLKFQKTLFEIQEARKNRNPKMIEKLNAAGINITLDEVTKASGGGQVGRPHFAKVLIQKKIVRDWDEAFKKYLRKGGLAYVNKRKLTSKEAIHAIHEAGGAAILAHPIQLGLPLNSKELLKDLKRLKGEGLDGIEAYTPCQTKKEAKYFKKVAAELDWIVTGGSDFHGTNKSVQLGFLDPHAGVTYEVVEEMKEAIKKISK